MANQPLVNELTTHLLSPPCRLCHGLVAGASWDGGTLSGLSRCPTTHLRCGASCGWRQSDWRAAPGWGMHGPGQVVLQNPASHPGRRGDTAPGSAHARAQREGMGMGSQADSACLGSGVQISHGVPWDCSKTAWNSQGGSIGWTLQFGDNLHPTR